MNRPSRVAVIIPAYQPSESLSGVVESVLNSPEIPDGHVFIVDDGSTKGAHLFDEILAAAPDRVTVLRHEVNRGKGAALKTAIAHILDADAFSTIVTVDADGQHTEPNIRAVLEKARTHEDGLTLGVRRFTGNVPLRSRFGNTVTKSVFSFFTGSAVSDTQTGLRAFRPEFAHAIKALPKDRYDFEQEMLMHAIMRGIPIREVPIETIYIDGNESSHFRPLVDSLRIYSVFLKYAASSLFGIMLDFVMFFSLYRLTGEILVSNVIARLTTMPVNYYVNKWFVFENRERYGMTFPQYAALATVNPFVSASLIYAQAAAGMPVPLAKIFAECVMFAVNYIVQTRIFRRRV